jgi:hypothetical protein
MMLQVHTAEGSWKYPPASVHFNGSVNLVDTDTVLREIASRVPTGVHRIPDGETGDRQHWIMFQLEKFWQTPGIERAGAQDQTQRYVQRPKVRLAVSADSSRLQWPNLGYADAYANSFESFRRMRAGGTIGGDVLFQVQYPTPLAAINAWFVAGDQPRVEPSYERALFADLQNLLARLPHADIAVQWDVAVEIAILESAFEAATGQDFDSIVQRLARCVDQVPPEVPVGLHLCYGDYLHSHYKEPGSLELQVRLTSGVAECAIRSISWVAFTVPQYQRSAEYFAPLCELRVPTETELNSVPRCESGTGHDRRTGAADRRVPGEHHRRLTV